MSESHAKINEVANVKAARTMANQDKITQQDIKPGDIVRVTYTNGVMREAVLEVDYATGKVAIVRQHTGAAESYTKRRLIPVSICTKVADGGGKFDPNNKIYAENHINIPDFYKQGNIVAKRKPSRSW